jgi:hypothetical protein
MTDYSELRKKYPKWAHRRDYHAKKRRRSRSRSRRRRRARATRRPREDNVTNLLLLQLLNQIMGPTTNFRTLARKHGENVVSGYAGGVLPDHLAPVRARSEYMQAGGFEGAPARVGAAAGAGHPRAPMPS